MVDNHFDVIIVGGGTSGVISAIAASRKGARTLLIEKNNFLGGSSTYGFPFLGFFSGNGEKIVDGIPQELIDRLIEEKGSPGHIRGGKWRTEEDYEFSLTPHDPEILKYVTQEMLLESGAKVLFNTFLINSIVDSDKIIGIEIANKSGRQVFYGDIFIDATGDVVLGKLSNAQFKIEDPQEMQNVTMMFNLKDIDIDKMVNELKNDGKIKGWNEWHTRIVKGPKIDTNDSSYVHFAGHMSIWDDRPPLTFTAVSWKKNQISLNLTRTVGINPNEAESFAEGTISERRNVIKTYKQCKRNIPGMESADLISTSHELGVRESRKLNGKYTIKKEDVLNCKNFSDGVARGGYPIDIHDPKGGKTQFKFLENGGSYSIPYRCLIPKDIRGLIVTGRGISATHEALGSTRLQATCMALGEAAGVAGGLCVNKKILPDELDGIKLSETLHEEGAIVKLV